MKKLIIASVLFIGFLLVNCSDSLGQEAKEHMTVEYKAVLKKYYVIDEEGKVNEFKLENRSFDGFGVVLKEVNKLTKEGWRVSHYGYSVDSGGFSHYSYLLEREVE